MPEELSRSEKIQAYGLVLSEKILGIICDDGLNSSGKTCCVINVVGDHLGPTDPELPEVGGFINAYLAQAEMGLWLADISLADDGYHCNIIVVN